MYHFNLCFYAIICYIEIIYIMLNPQGRESAVGIVTRYGLDSAGFESRWG